MRAGDHYHLAAEGDVEKESDGSIFVFPQTILEMNTKQQLNEANGLTQRKFSHVQLLV